MTSLADLLDPGADPSQVLVYADGEQHTCAEITGRAAAVSSQLGEAGVQPGQPVGVMLPDTAEVVAALFGVWRAGAVSLPLNPRLAPPEVERILAAVRPAAIVTAHDPSGDSGRRNPALRVSATGVRAARHDPDVALAMLTSGTTGPPKPVLLRHSGVLTLLDGVVRRLRSDARAGTQPRRPMPNLVPVSLSLWAGIYQVLFAFRVGAPVVLMRGFETTTFVDLVRRFEIRSTVLPPAAMTMLADDPDVTDLAPLKYVRSISAPLSPFEARRFQTRFGISVLNGYGQTEIGGEIVGWSAADAKRWGNRKLGSVGRPHEGVEVRVIGADGEEVPVDELGELWVRTPAMSAGYADGGDLGDRLSPEGWFRTGDVGRVDGDGFVWVEGRVSDMINRGGLKVFPAEVAEVIRLAPAVAEVAVVGVPDRRLGEVPWAFIVPAGEGTDVDPAELEARCRRHLAPYKVPVRFEALDALPRNDAGKVLTAELLSVWRRQRG